MPGGVRAAELGGWGGDSHRGLPESRGGAERFSPRPGPARPRPQSALPAPPTPCPRLPRPGAARPMGGRRQVCATCTTWAGGAGR